MRRAVGAERGAFRIVEIVVTLQGTAHPAGGRDGNDVAVPDLRCDQIMACQGHDQQRRAVGAGEGEVVLVVQGSSARLGADDKDSPVDAVVIGIVDQVEIANSNIYRAG